MKQGILYRYGSKLPLTAKTPLITLGEGETPLIHAEKLSSVLGIELYLKIEGANPTGSFKDRGMVLAVAKALEEGSQGIICASTGNTSASAAAYAARAGLRCAVVIPDGYVALGKLSQAIVYGAEVIAIKGNFDEALALVRELTKKDSFTLVNSLNPHRIEGQKTAAFEVCEQLGRAPDILALPVGNAGNITAYWKGFTEWSQENGGKLPELWGFEAAGAAAITTNHPIQEPQTVATAIRIGNPASWETAVQAVTDTKGRIASVTDEEILAAYQKLAREEGIFVEPASAAAIAGLQKMQWNGLLPKGAQVVAVLTGTGLKDPEIISKVVPKQPQVIPAEIEALRLVLLGEER